MSVSYEDYASDSESLREIAIRVNSLISIGSEYYSDDDIVFLTTAFDRISSITKRMNEYHALDTAMCSLFGNLSDSGALTASFMYQCKTKLGIDIKDLFSECSAENYKLISKLYTFFVEKGNLQSYGYILHPISEVQTYTICLNSDVESASYDTFDSEPIYKQDSPGCYIVPCSDGRIKIGSSKDMRSRVLDVASIVRCYTGYEIEKSYCIPCNKYRELEKHLHSQFSSKRLHGEIFDIDF